MCDITSSCLLVRNKSWVLVIVILYPCVHFTVDQVLEEVKPAPVRQFMERHLHVWSISYTMLSKRPREYRSHPHQSMPFCPSSNSRGETEQIISTFENINCSPCLVYFESKPNKIDRVCWSDQYKKIRVVFSCSVNIFPLIQPSRYSKPFCASQNWCNLYV